MESLDIILDGDGAFNDLQLSQKDMGKINTVTLLTDGTVKGNPTVALLVEVDGIKYVVETTWRLFYNANVALQARYGIPK